MKVADAGDAIRAGIAAIGSGNEHSALDMLSRATRAYPENARLWQVRALVHRALDDLAPAVASFERAASLAPSDFRIALGHAQSALEAGYPAVELFERALGIAPDKALALPGLAAAQLAAGAARAAIERVEAHLHTHPAWLAGHWTASRLRWLVGDRARYTASLERALAVSPGDVGLWRQRISTLLMAKQYEEALAAVWSARSSAGEDSGFDLDEAICLSETWRLSDADRLYTLLPAAADPKVAVHRVRHLLRCQRPEQAAQMALPLIKHQEGNLLLPYLSLAWRMTGDRRWRWLEGSEHLIGVYDLAPKLPCLDTVARFLRPLHVAAEQPPEQSLRGGTQTDGPLFSRADPLVRQLRDAAVSAIADHLAQMPPPDPEHPALGPSRNAPIRFAGSWSARFVGCGHHAPHVHPQGWFSSALYIALPGPEHRGASPAGWLSLGQPDESLGLDLPPLRQIEPRPGRLVLFPSTMWHGTLPYPAGERLTVAFDVAVPSRN